MAARFRTHVGGDRSHVDKIHKLQLGYMFIVVHKVYDICSIVTYHFGSHFHATRDLGCAYVSTQEGGESHDGFGALVSTTFPLFPNQQLARDLPHPSWVYIRNTYEIAQDCQGISGAVVVVIMILRIVIVIIAIIVAAAAAAAAVVVVVVVVVGTTDPRTRSAPHPDRSSRSCPGSP